MNSKLSKLGVFAAHSTKTHIAQNTVRRRLMTGYVGRLNAKAGNTMKFRSEIERLRQENQILREERSEIYLNASYMMAHS